MFRSVDELELTVNNQILHGDLEKALQNITQFVNDIISQPWCDGIVLSAPQLDRLCLHIGNKFLQQHSYQAHSSVDNNTLVYITTKLYGSGGHTAIIEEFINNQPDKQHVILMTDLFDCADWNVIINRFKNSPVVIKRAPAGKMTTKLKWIMQELTDINPHKTYLFNHQFDAVAIAAVQPNLVNDLIFYHHSDFQLTLGIHLDHAIHIDIHNRALFYCRDNLAVKNTLYWPLTAADIGARQDKQFFNNNQPLKTCSSGSLNKFNVPYAYDYKHLIADIIKTTQGTHVHIGAITPKYLKQIQQHLLDKNIEPKRFVHIPWVKSVWQTLSDQQIDLYICSFPYGGGKTAVEVMGSGTPMIVHDNYAVPLGGAHVVYPQAYQWRKPVELLTILQNITHDDLIKHSLLSRQHYEKYHQEHFVKDQLAKPAHLMQGMTPLPLPHFKRDELQSALDTYEAVKQKIKKDKLWRNSMVMQLIKKYYKRSRRSINVKN